MRPDRDGRRSDDGADAEGVAVVPTTAGAAMPSAYRLADGGDPSAARDVDVLVACADEDARQIVGTVLRHEGWRVLEIADPAQAVATAWARHPLLVVTSFPAALADGRTVTMALRADRRTADLPILNVTGRALPDELAQAAAAGVTASLVMPVPPLRVVAEVHRLLGAAGSAARTGRLASRQRPDGRGDGRGDGRPDGGADPGTGVRPGAGEPAAPDLP